MKQKVLSVVDRLAKRAAKNMALSKPRGDSFDILEVAFLQAAWETAELYQKEFLTCAPHETDLDLLTAAMEAAPRGLCLEFGVATGRTISHLATRCLSQRFFGFDSFEGLPEAWRSHFDKGAFTQDLPSVPSNVTLIKGWFNETLPTFLQDHMSRVAFLHVDCDLYSSTKTILDSLHDRLVSGTVIVFDEFWNYPGWQSHEYKAFKESGLKAKPFGFVPGHQQVGFVLV